MQIEIFEVGPRDGLQNETRAIPTAEKIALIDCLSGAGFKRIEIASFVSPKWVPQMADGEAVAAGITRRPGTHYCGMTPNTIGLNRAIAARVDEIAVFASASEGFSKANINATIDESLERFKPVIRAALHEGIPIRGYVSCVVECPYDGPVDPGAVGKVAKALWDMGCYEISLGDTIGRGRPEAVAAMLSEVTQIVPPRAVAGHFHDTSRCALANIDVSIDYGLRVFDAAVGGLGGCPYAPGAAGNVATEEVLAHLTARGFETGIDAAVVEEAAQLARKMRGQDG